jgi:ArsR family transcriptional regulator
LTIVNTSSEETSPVNTKSLGRCCEPLTAGALTEHQAAELAGAFKALADPTRLRLFWTIASIPDGEACACDLVGPIGKSQPTVSHHLSILVEAGLRSARHPSPGSAGRKM